MARDLGEVKVRLMSKALIDGVRNSCKSRLASVAVIENLAVVVPCKSLSLA